MKRALLLIQVLLVFSLTKTWAQEVVTGQITSQEDGSALPGVNVVVEGTNEGTITDVDGNYNIEASGDATLVFSYVGFIQESIPVNNRSVIDVALVPDLTELSEVVVTAFGVEREKKALGYSMTEVDGEDLSTVKESNPVNSLAGKVAGIVITPTAFGPGSSSRVILRGNNSLTGNNQPLYVVDGIPMDNTTFGSAGTANTGEYSKTDYGGGISDINPDDIESISVLKGPNAAALYGSRASNGVILITTKKGSARKGIGVSLTSNVTFQTPLVLPDFQNEYGQGTQGNVDVEAGGSWGAPLDGSSQPYYTGENRPYVAQPDNVKDFFRTGSNIVNTISLEGGNEDANVRFSYTNNVSNSIVPNSNIMKHNFNLRGFSNLTDKLSLDSKITYSNLEGENRVTLGTEGIVADLYDIPRNVRLDDLKDFQDESNYAVRTYTQDTDGNVAGDGPNPYWVINHDKNDDVRERLLGFVKANYQFTDNFSAFARIGGDFVSQKIESVNQFGHWFYGDGRFSYSQEKSKEINADFLLTYDAKIGSEFNIAANFGGNHRYEEYESQGVNGDGFKIPTQATVASATNLFPSYSFEQPKKVNSLYGSVQLAFMETIYIDVTGRNDWSSTLAADNRSYFYPSANLSVLVNEFIDPDRNIFNLLKTRVSWAQVGNDTDPFQLHNTYNLIQDGYLGRTTLSRPDTRYFADLKPEQVSTIEFGVEWSMFENRVYGDVTYYDITSEDLIWAVPVSQSTGYTYFNTNVGKLTNKGVEILVGGTPVKSNNFSWDISANMAHNENKLEELIEDLDNYTFTTTNSGIVSVYATAGGGYGDIYGSTYQRDPNGNIIVDDNGRLLGTSEKVHLGNYQPDWVGGLSNTLTYKDITLKFLIDARFGGEIFSGADAGLDASGVSTNSLQYRESGVVVDGVVNTGTPEDPVYEPNTTNVNAQQYWGSYSGIASNYVFDQTNIRMREMSLTYTLPQSLLANTFIQRASIGFIGRNLFFLQKEMENFDPETSYSSSAYSQGVLFYTLPSTRSLGFHVNVNF